MREYREYEVTASVKNKHSLMRIATLASIGVACTLIAVKFGGWVMTGSVSLLSTLVDSFLDFAASIINFIAVYHAIQPADKEHRFGHGKAEPIAGLVQASFISGSAIFLLFEAGERLIKPRSIEYSEIGYAVLIFSIILTVILVIFQGYVVKKSGSVAIQADSVHYKTDVAINVSVIASIFLSTSIGWLFADAIFAIGIAAYIFKSAIEIGYSSLNMLMDHELPELERQNIVKIATKPSEVRGVHDLRTRSSGANYFIQLHLEMDGNMILSDAHELAEQVMLNLQAAYPNAEVIIHQDPEGVEEERAIF